MQYKFYGKVVGPIKKLKWNVLQLQISLNIENT